MSDKPVIFLAFANEKENESAKLRLLSKERKSIEQVIDRNTCEIVIVESTSPDDIFDKFNDPFYANRIVVFHYAGHANSFGILLENHEQSTGNTHFRAEGLVDFLAQQSSLRLVFLNACSTKDQAHSLQQKGVPNVIATSQSINDAVAAELSEKFYQALALQKPIAQALTEAGSMVKGKSHGGSFRDLHFEGMEASNEEATGIPWDLYGQGNWWLGADADKGLASKLIEGSQAQYTQRKAQQDSQSFISSEGNHWIKRTATVLGESTGVSQVLPLLWEKPSPHSILLGAPGMGKTSSMIHLWRKLLEREGNPIPVYIPLSEYNSNQQRDKGMFFINYLVKVYFDKIYGDKTLAEDMLQWLEDKQADGRPKLVLLLDGLNEVTSNKQLVIGEIEYWKKLAGVQVVVSSRMAVSANWASGFHPVVLEEIALGKMTEFITEHGLPVPANPYLQKQLQNPLMLSIYTCTEEVAIELEEGVEIKKNPSTQGELLHNFFMATLSRKLGQSKQHPLKQHLYRWVFWHLLPRIAYEMEHYLSNSARSQKLARRELKKIVHTVIDELEDESALETSLAVYPESYGFWDALLDEEIQKPTYAQLREIIEDDLQILVKVNGYYQFFQSIIRDHLSAQYLINQARWGAYHWVVPTSWTERLFPSKLAKMIGELEGDYQNKPIFSNGAWQQTITPNATHAFIEACKQDSLKSNDAEGKNIYVHKAVWNIINIWAVSRDQLLVGERLDQLDLTRVPLQGLIFSLPGLPASSFNYAFMNEANWISQGHILRINMLTYNSDGRYALSASEDNTIREWDLNSGECFMTLKGHEAEVIGVWYSDNEKLVVSADREGIIRVWEVATKSHLYSISGEEIASGRGIVVFSKKPEAWIRHDGYLKSFNCRTGELSEVDGGAEFIPYSILPNDSWIVGTQGEHKISYYYGKTGLPDVSMAHTHEEPLTQIAMNHDARKVITIDEAGCINEWNADTGERINQLNPPHEDQPPFNLEYHPTKDRYALMVYPDMQEVTEVHLDEQTVSRLGAHQVGVSYARYSPEGNKILMASELGDISEWEVEAAECLININKGFSMHMLNAIANQETVSVNDITEVSEQLSFHFIPAIDYSSDGKKAIWGSEEGVLQEWNLEAGNCLRVIKAHEQFVSHCVYADDEYIVTASIDGTAKLWNLLNNQLLNTYDHGDAINALTIDRVGGTLMTGGDNGWLKVWDWQKGECIHEELIHEGGVTDLYMHPSEHRMLSGGSNGLVAEWDTQTWECLNAWQATEEEVGISAVCYEKTGEHGIFATSTGYLCIWNFESGEIEAAVPVVEMESEDTPTIISDLDYSPLTGNIVCSVEDGSVREYSLDTAASLHVIQAHVNYAMAIRYSPDGTRALSSALDGAVKEWLLEEEQCEYVYPCLNWSVNGCSMLGQENNMPESIQRIMKLYGAIL